MAITIIPNQPVRFNNIADPEACACLGQEYSQLINKDDQTQFQISSTDQVTNGSFPIDLSGWGIYEGIEVNASITNESETGECDGEITATATGGVAPYTYSINGGSFGSGTFTGLCPGTYIITAKDSDANQGSVTAGITTAANCAAFTGSDANDLLLIDSATIINCFANNFI